MYSYPCNITIGSSAFYDPFNFFYRSILLQVRDYKPITVGYISLVLYTFSRFYFKSIFCFTLIRAIKALTTPEKNSQYEELLGIELAITAHTISGTHPDLSDALYEKVRLILQYSCGRQTENIENFFNEHR